MISFKQRASLSELMDNPAGDRELLDRTLDQLHVVNMFFSRNRYCAKKLLIPHMLRQQRKSFTVCDIGAGACDFGLWLSGYAIRHGLRVHMYCVDNDIRVVEHARIKCRKNDLVTIIHDSALNLASFAFKPDYIFSNHFIHHLSDTDLVKLFELIDMHASYGYVINDLKRSPISWTAFYLFGIVFLHKSFSLTDGLISIRRGFTEEELSGLLAKAGVADARIENKWPGRLIISKLR